MILLRFSIVISLVLLVRVSAFGQELVSLYYNDSWQLTISKEATFVRQAEVTFHGDSLVWNGQFTDSTIEGKLLREGTYRNNLKQGLFKFYHDNTVLESTGEYTDDRRVDEWKYYNDYGGIKQLVIFNGDDFTIKEFFDNKDKLLVSEGTGNWKLFVPFGNKVVSLDAYFSHGQRSGKWVYRYSPGGKILVEEYSEGGEVLEGIDYQKKGNPTYQKTKLTSSLFEIPSILRAEQLVTDHHFYGPDAIRYIKGIGPRTVEHPGLVPTYTGGIEEFYNYVLQNYRYPESAFAKRLEGQVIIDFLIDDQGNTSNFRVMRGISQELNAEAVRLISSTEGWVPAEYNGQTVNARKSVPITFKLK
ncbi:MAG: TonB family protein [Cyclobacteriaceae bacterium]